MIVKLSYLLPEDCPSTIYLLVEYLNQRFQTFDVKNKDEDKDIKVHRKTPFEIKGNNKIVSYFETLEKSEDENESSQRFYFEFVISLENESKLLKGKCVGDSINDFNEHYDRVFSYWEQAVGVSLWSISVNFT